MWESLKKKVELVAHLATIVIALVLSYAVLGGQRAALRPEPVRYPEPQAFVPVRPGAKLSLPGIDWTKNERTVLLALSRGCHFCSESAPFYQRLSRELSALEGVGLMAVFPQPVEEARDYLNNLDVPIEDIRQLPLNSLGVLGTPTLIVVNKEGVVTNAWRGQLPSRAEDEVLSQLGCGAGKCG